jgi:hypothetical protein
VWPWCAYPSLSCLPTSPALLLSCPRFVLSFSSQPLLLLLFGL